MPPKQEKKNEVEDSASSAAPAANKETSSESKPEGKDKKKGGRNNPKGNTPNIGPSPNARNPPPSGYSEGNKVLESYGLSVLGRKERVLSAIKTEKYFHLVEDCWNQLVDAKPMITERFSLNEFRHCAALQLYQRIEQVKFDAVGTKPSAPTRIPLPRNLRVFQPIWSALAHIGIVDDDDLRATYIPDSILPTSKDLDNETDVENLISCTLYDWPSSWEGVEKARGERTDYDSRLGYEEVFETNEAPQTREQLMKEIVKVRTELKEARRKTASDEYRLINGVIYKVPTPSKGQQFNDISDDEVRRKNQTSESVDEVSTKLDVLMLKAKQTKEEMIRPRRDRSYQIESYKISDGTVTVDPGAYGAWLRWDPRLWLDYEQMVEILNPVAMFSLSMPVDTSGTYAWLLPVESRDMSSEIFCKMPKASVPPAVWIFSLILQSSTLPHLRRSTWYCESDRLTNLLGLRARYIRAAIKRAAPTEQYGTY
uniref:CP n=1 Tax=Fusarium equiseti partitivirus 1 TaxID=2784448 RepID=A0A7S6XLD4_9VIRU|nr:CP [Fusarium equiseti partitivirus 1]